MSASIPPPQPCHAAMPISADFDNQNLATMLFPSFSVDISFFPAMFSGSPYALILAACNIPAIPFYCSLQRVRGISYAATDKFLLAAITQRRNLAHLRNHFEIISNMPYESRHAVNFFASFYHCLQM